MLQRLSALNPIAPVLARLGASEPRAPLKARLRAWWDGVEVSALPPETLERPEKAPEGDDEAPARRGLFARLRGREAKAWADPRLTVMERIWGEGMTGPGGRDFVLALIVSLGVDKKMGLIEIGAGLGGAARIIARETGAWVTGLEPSAELAEAGMELSVRARLKKRAPIEHCDLARLELDPASLPVIFSLETFYAVADKTEFYAKLYRALKSEGQLLFTDFIVPETNPQGERYRKWAAKEAIEPQPWTIEETRSCLEYHGFEVRIAEDITADYRRMALSALNGFAEGLEPGRIDKPLAAAVLGEVERWSRRLGLLGAGELAVYRIYARKQPEARH